MIKQSKGVYACQNYIQELVVKLEDVYLTNQHSKRASEYGNKKAMALRGLLLAMSYPEFSSVSWHLITLSLLKVINNLLDDKEEN